MGCLNSKDIKDTEKGINDEIDKQIQLDNLKKQKEIKLLLLGTGESGKSTILKQIKLINNIEFTNDEKEFYKNIIYDSLIEFIYYIIENKGEYIKNNIDFEDYNYIIDNKNKYVENLKISIFFRVIKKIWNNENIKKNIINDILKFNENIIYYLNSINRISDKNFIPINEDILYSRIKTTGILEIKININDYICKFLDIGGQRSERKKIFERRKILECFDDVAYIIFIVAISEYDQVLYEDDETNRLQESIMLFDNICNSKWFYNTPIILFLNKIDLFREKIKTIPLKNYLNDYYDYNDYNKSIEYIKNKFEKLNKNSQRKIYTYLTCATDTKYIKEIMENVNNIIINLNLKNVGLI